MGGISFCTATLMYVFTFFCERFIHTYLFLSLSLSL